ncbi:MAG: Bifunctional purine biosynthesis protein PurH [Firmicutes bacterium ADurb.Bin506]|nr:MAG: Bifunctional purine biosynthesis protein PurH [Firmicutes bacterium ADurb.Bin506]
MGGVKAQSLRYGENPHQKAAFYRIAGAAPRGLAAARQLAGKELSYNNIMDSDLALAAAAQFSAETCVVIVKHGNPCGIGIGANLAEAYRTALACDPVSAYGGIVACTRPLDGEAALLMKELFLEVIVAPGFTNEARAALAKKSNLRLLEIDEADLSAARGWQVRPVLGGFLVQEADSTSDATECDITVVTKRAPSDEEMHQLRMAWKAVARVKSNAIVLWKGNGTVGVGAGQMNRVLSARIAIEAAGDGARGSVMGSDAYFPFSDTVEAAAAAGVTAVIQPGGSVRDKDSIDACDAHGMAMVFTGRRHFLH